jgi:hypothetical protein
MQNIPKIVHLLWPRDTTFKNMEIIMCLSQDFAVKPWKIKTG